MNFVKLLDAVGITVLLANLIFLMVTLVILCVSALYYN